MLGASACYEVVHDKIALRKEPNTKATMVGVVKNGEILRGIPTNMGGKPWLKLDDATIELQKVRVAYPDVNACWALIDGASVGLGELLKKTLKSLPAPVIEDSLAKAAPEPAKKQNGQIEKQASGGVEKFLKKAEQFLGAYGTEAKNEAKNGAKKTTVHLGVVLEEGNDGENETKTVMRQAGSRGEYVVAHTKVVERKQPKVSAAPVKVRPQGHIVEGVPYDVDDEPWLKLDTGWMLIDGISVNLGMLLLPAVDIAEDIMAWAEQHKAAPEGKKMNWTDETEGKLRSLEQTAREQVAPLKPALENLSVLQELEKSNIISPQDFSLGTAELEKLLLRFLLRARAGVLLFEEVDVPNAVWQHGAFTSLVQSVGHLIPYHCRTLSPDCPTQRVLVLFHGGAVRGDDLVEDSKILRITMPSTAIVLPEAPVVVDAEHELRSWWRTAIAGQEVPSVEKGNSEEEVKAFWKVALKAPQDAIERAVVTIKTACTRFGDVPLIIGGFSQGSVLAAQSLLALDSAGIQAQGLIILSGLMMPFEHKNVRCHAIHGYKDARVTLAHAQSIAAEMPGLTLDVIPGLEHEITDVVLEKVHTFCDKVAKVDDSLAGKTRDIEVRNSQIHQAKLLRWVTNFSKMATMFDNDYFLSLILDEKCVRLGPEFPSIGKFKYYMHDAGPSSRGLVVLFHGKIANVAADTRELAEAYMKSLKLSVAVIDYRPKFSTLSLDAQVTFEAIEQLSKSTSSPIIIHGTGLGAILAMHCGMASQALPTVVQQRFRLLVLDAPVACMKALPPIPTGCIAVDPIGNDNKLKYISMPVCLMSGDDRCSGIKTAPKHWAAMSGACDVLKKEGKMVATLIDDVALQVGSNGARLQGGLYKAVLEALEKEQRSTDKSVAQAFINEIEAGDAEEEELTRHFDGKEKEVKSLMEKALEAAKNKEAEKRLWEIRSMSEPQRSEELSKLSAQIISPILKEMDGFADGVKGVSQLDIVASKLGKEDESLKEVQDEIRDALDCRRLDRQAADLQRKNPQFPTLDALHGTIETAHKYWNSEECYNQLRARVLEGANGTVTKMQISNAVSQRSAELSSESAKELFGKGSAEEALALQGQAFGVYQSIDTSLAGKSMKLQGIVAGLISKLIEDLGAVNRPALSDKVAPLPLPPPEWFDGAELDVVVYIDREFDLSIPLRATRGCKVRDLKQLLAQADDSGSLSVDQVFFKVQGHDLTIHDDCLVSERLKELDLLEAEVLPMGYVDLSREQAMGMLRELAEGFAAPSFQKKLRDAKKKSSQESAEFTVARATAVLDVQKNVISKYGFKPNPIGVKHMMASMGAYNFDPETELLNSYINKMIMPT